MRDTLILRPRLLWLLIAVVRVARARCDMWLDIPVYDPAAPVK